MGKAEVDYSLYLVTDSTPDILGTGHDRDLCRVVAEALDGGVKIVQYRDKTGDTAQLVATAKRLHELTARHGVPLLVNDRVDVALAVGCEGVHLGQDDMDISTARKLLGPDAIIGISASTAEEALEACRGGADYLGIGAVFATATKTNTKNVLGTAGVRLILASMCNGGFAQTPAVAIGGLNKTNIQRVVFQTGSSRKNLSGVAVVSAIVRAADPRAASRELLCLVKELPPFRPAAGRTPADQPLAHPNDLLALAPAIIKAVRWGKPMSHNMTNLVVQNMAANVALAVGASPIMSNVGEEAADLARLGGALVVNMGTVTPESLRNYLMALKEYNLAGRPVIFDPVGAGATAVRRNAVKTILAGGYTDVIKGNESEILAVLAARPPVPSSITSISHPFPVDEVQQRGVDSASSLDDLGRARATATLAASEKNVVLLTGVTDHVSDGKRTFAVRHGHALLGQVTGAGCCLGTVISACCAVYPDDKLAATVAGLLLFEIAAEIAAGKCEGPGTFLPAFVDALASCSAKTVEGDLSWFRDAKIEEVVL